MQRILQAGERPALCMDQGAAYVCLGLVEYEWNNLGRAEDYLRKGIALCRQTHLQTALLGGLYLLVKIMLLYEDEAGARRLLKEHESDLLQEDYHLNSPSTYTKRAQIALVLGETTEALRWMQEYTIGKELTLNFDPTLEEYYLVQARILLSSEQEPAAERVLRTLNEAACVQKRSGSLLRILILQSLLYQAGGERDRAFSSLAQALSLGEAEGYTRVFLDEGAGMLALLVEFRERRRKGSNTGRPLCSPQYLDRLVSLLKEVEHRASRDEQLLIEPLSQRELEVLQLVSEGKSNRDVARQLIIATSTVKSHLNTIYSKLQVQSRTQAIVRANALHLL